MRIGDKEYPIKYTIGDLEHFYELTGVDLLFAGSPLDTLELKIAFVFVGTKYENVRDLEPVEFTDIFNECLKKYNAQFEEKTTKGKVKKKLHLIGDGFTKSAVMQKLTRMMQKN